ncbi:MAG: ATP-binding cassette domain-containing protein, partial [Ilumatobacteraceae bacterium]
AEHRAPLHQVGALLEAKAVHNGRTARNHLLVLAATCGISDHRVDELIELVGLSDVASKRVGGFSLGMGQRLGIAAALLGDPATLILDEPVNGLDPEGVLWIRHLLRSLAREGRTIFVSSHLMSEMALTADHLIVIGRGRLIADVSVADFTRHASSDLVYIRTPEAERLRNLLVGATVHVTAVSPGRLEVIGLTSDEIGDLAAANMIPLHELIPHQASLEDAFMSLTHDAVEYQTTDVAS